MEREYKWIINDPSDFDHISGNDIIASLVTDVDRLDMEAVYYDTADGLIAKAHGGLRLRKENEKAVVCLKLAAQSAFDGAKKSREEYECFAQDIHTGIRQLPTAGAPQDFCDALLQAELVEMGRSCFTRFCFQLSYQNCTCELAFDYGELIRHNNSALICEMELELKSGSETDFDALAMTLQKEFRLKAQPLSKLARMLQL